MLLLEDVAVDHQRTAVEGEEAPEGHAKYMLRRPARETGAERGHINAVELQIKLPRPIDSSRFRCIFRYNSLRP